MSDSIEALKALHDEGFLCLKTDRYPHIKYRSGRYRLYVPYIYGESYLTYGIKDEDLKNFDINETIKMIKKSMIDLYNRDN